MSQLVIVESPTKAKTIKKLLGPKYQVLATVGHLRDLPKSTFGVDIENDFEPKYINIRGKGPVIKDLKKAAKQADRVFLATDPDREGEAISWHLSTILDIDPKAPVRVEFHEITKDTVREQVKHPREINIDLVDAQQARRVLDRIVGYKISPLLWKKVKGKLSAGRVQSVVVKLICEREEQIRNFVPEQWWTIDAQLKKKTSKIEAQYVGRLKKGSIAAETLKDENIADSYLKEFEGQPMTVHSLKTTQKSKSPYAPFTTSTLQQEASRRLNFKTGKTMRIAQSLYEGVTLPKVGSVGLITYMRTDSTRISDVARAAAKEFILEAYGKDYFGAAGGRGNKKGVQDAHECIRPTDVRRTPQQVKDSLSRDEFRLYQLIWSRFIASQMSAARYEQTALSLRIHDAMFRASGSRLIFDGFTRVYGSGQKDHILPKFEEGEEVKVESMEKNQHFSQPPARYNEASLIKTLEELRIGRPSTYAPILSTIQSRYYVVLEEKRFVPTELGEAVNAILSEYFPDLLNQEFTAEMEESLDLIAEGKMPWKDLVRQVYDTLREDLDRAEEEVKKVSIKEEESDVVCEKCGRKMVIKMGPYGKFLGCPGFPECRNTKPFEEKIGVRCPKCHEGEVVLRRSKKGRKFYGCSRYPECDFVSWNEPLDTPCPKCGGVVTKRLSKKGGSIQCENPSCNWSKAIALDKDS